MGGEGYIRSWRIITTSGAGGPATAPVGSVAAAGKDGHWTNFENSMNAVSFGFLATAILISMFLIMAIFERLFRSRTAAGSRGRNGGDLEGQRIFNGKLDYPSPKMSIYARGVSVLMPGEEVPTFIAHPAPAPCPPESIPRPFHQHGTF